VFGPKHPPVLLARTSPLLLIVGPLLIEHRVILGKPVLVRHATRACLDRRELGVHEGQEFFRSFDAEFQRIVLISKNVGKKRQWSLPDAMTAPIISRRACVRLFGVPFLRPPVFFR
jgi:hypothetical protein